MSVLLLINLARSLPQRHYAKRTVTAMANKTVHWDSKTCPYAQRSWIALIEKGLPFEIKVEDLQNKSKEFCELYSQINPDPNAAAKVPILIDGDVRLIESNIICEYLAAKYADQGEQLLPTDPVAAAKVRLFIETFSSQVTNTMFALFRADTQEGVAAAKDKLAHGLQVLDRFLQWHGSPSGGDYFLGAQYSLAETCCTSFVQRALVMLAHYRSVDLWGLVKEHKLDRLERWMQTALARPSARDTKPADEVIIAGMGKFVVPLKD